MSDFRSKAHARLGVRRVRDCLGRVRGIEKTYADGSYNCPFCSYAVHGADSIAKGCKNPACTARTDERGRLDFPTDRAEKAIAENKRRIREEEQRQRNHVMAMQRIEQGKKDRDERLHALVAEAKRRGACVHCALKSHKLGDKRFVKHRGACPAGGRS